MSVWQVAGASVRGESHRASGSPNQDSIQWTLDDGVQGSAAVVALADGHGSARSFRSETGARMASETAMRVLPMVAADLTRRDGALVQSDFDAIADGILDAWRGSVVADLDQHPVTNAERESVRRLPNGSGGLDELDRNPYVAYGATLVAALATPRMALFVQLGDGDTLAVSSDGTVSRPLPADRRLIANETTSLSTAGSADFRIGLVPLSVNPPELILVSSDGYANSFADDEAFEQIGSDLLHMLRERGIAWVQDQLDEWLATASREGSGDDISLGLLWRPRPSATTPATRGRALSRPGTTLVRRRAGPPRPRSDSQLSPNLRWLLVIVGLAAAVALGYVLGRLYLAAG